MKKCDLQNCVNLYHLNRYLRHLYIIPDKTKFFKEEGQSNGYSSRNDSIFSG